MVLVLLQAFNCDEHCQAGFTSHSWEVFMIFCSTTVLFFLQRFPTFRYKLIIILRLLLI